MANKFCAYTRFNLPPLFRSESGNRFREEYKEIINDEGLADIEVSGKYDLQAYIDSFRDDCDIYKILDRLNVSDKTPDVVLEALTTFRPDMFKPGDTYADFTNMPKNIHEVAKLHRDAVAFFNGLPSEVRKEYGFSVDRFFADFDNFIKKYGNSASAPVPAAASAPVEKGDVIDG